MASSRSSATLRRRSTCALEQESEIILQHGWHRMKYGGDLENVEKSRTSTLAEQAGAAAENMNVQQESECLLRKDTGGVPTHSGLLADAPSRPRCRARCLMAVGTDARRSGRVPR
mmetsp:Transcript_71217/g.231386  ORF Transcript_71217/g.231386 Transcript_71217/m.231386 type:complete len:115 (-) Transcript_71217:1987-2331(-)